MQQRYYDPMLGRFLSVDPVTATSVGGNFNRYWYGNDNPYKFTDPDGRYSRGSGWTNDQWRAFNSAQRAASGRLTRAANNLQKAMDKGGKTLERATARFEGVFGKGSATTENMTAVVGSLRSMAGLLNDSSPSASASAQDLVKSRGDEFKNAAMATPRESGGSRQVIVNTAHSQFGNVAEMTISVAHESFHGTTGLLDQVGPNGSQAYSGASAAELQAYNGLSTDLRLQSAEHVSNYGMDR